jgi:hypothetical protein
VKGIVQSTLSGGEAKTIAAENALYCSTEGSQSETIGT